MMFQLLKTFDQEIWSCCTCVRFGDIVRRYLLQSFCRYLLENWVSLVFKKRGQDHCIMRSMVIGKWMVSSRTDTRLRRIRALFRARNLESQVPDENADRANDCPDKP
jgi:hypothetical protein